MQQTHSTVVAARNLLTFRGYCYGCDDPIDIEGAGARDNVHVHTVDPLPRPEPQSPIRTPDWSGRRRPYAALLREEATDWPALLCRFCHHALRDGGLTSFVEYLFAQHPECPRCGARRTQRIGYGMPDDPDSWGPWLDIGGCCRKPEKWHCSVCNQR